MDGWMDAWMDGKRTPKNPFFQPTKPAPIQRQINQVKGTISEPTKILLRLEPSLLGVDMPTCNDC